MVNNIRREMGGCASKSVKALKMCAVPVRTFTFTCLLLLFCQILLHDLLLMCNRFIEDLLRDLTGGSSSQVPTLLPL